MSLLFRLLLVSAALSQIVPGTRAGRRAGDLRAAARRGRRRDAAALRRHQSDRPRLPDLVRRASPRFCNELD